MRKKNDFCINEKQLLQSNIVLLVVKPGREKPSISKKKLLKKHLKSYKPDLNIPFFCLFFCTQIAKYTSF